MSGFAFLSPVIPPLVDPPSNLPDASKLLKFDVEKVKHEIFESVRERVRDKAQYTNTASLVLLRFKHVHVSVHLWTHIYFSRRESRGRKSL